MKTELQEKLYNKYPEIFRQKDLPMSQTCMCWGIDHGNGWYDILDNLCAIIQSHVRYHKLPQVEAVQVKEKYGTLRFYTNHTDEYVSGAIGMAERMTGVTCEVCGSPGKTYTQGWWVTRCEEHARKEGRTEKEIQQSADADFEDDGC